MFDGLDYTAILMPRISGNAGAAGVTLTYIDGTEKTVTSQVDGSYTLPVPPGWSGTVTPSHPCYTFNPVDRTYNAVASDLSGENYTPALDAGAGCSNITAEIGGTTQGQFGLLPGASTRASFTGINSGPVKLASTNTIPLIGAERLIYKVGGVNASYIELMGLPDSQVDNTYWLPWYNNVDLDTQLRIANVSGNTATIHIFIGTDEVTAGLSLVAGGSIRQSFSGVNSGPVKIVSDQNIVATERVVYTVTGVNTSYSEMNALPESQLDMTYWLPWYNNVDLDTQLRIANVSNSASTVHVFIGTDEVTPTEGIPLGVGESQRLSYTGVNDGPVRIVRDQNIVAAERVIYKVAGKATSFTEMMALPNSQLDTTYWLPWYNNVDLDTHLRIGNVSDSTATVHIFIGGDDLTAPNGITLLSGESTRLSFSSTNNGPVQIVSDQKIVVAERMIYKVGGVATSFSEMMGLPNLQLDTTYWFPWYNNVDLDTQLRFGVPQP
jgi:hypothetical protein